MSCKPFSGSLATLTLAVLRLISEGETFSMKRCSGGADTTSTLYVPGTSPLPVMMLFI